MPITRRYLSKKRKRMTLRDKRQKKHKIGGGPTSLSLEKYGFPVMKNLDYVPEETSTDDPLSEPLKLTKRKTIHRTKRKGIYGNNNTLLFPQMSSPIRAVSENVYGFPPEVGYDDIIKGYNIKLKDCSHRNECLKWILVGLYVVTVEPQFKKLYETLERAKQNNELSDLEYNTKKNYLTGRHMENRNVLVNIINKNNFDSLPIPIELQNPSGNVRTKIYTNKIIDTNNKWIQAYEECLYFYTKLATSEFYGGYDCKIEYPIFKKNKPDTKTSISLKKKNKKL